VSTRSRAVLGVLVWVSGLACDQPRQKPAAARLEEARTQWREAEENLVVEVESLKAQLKRRGEGAGGDEAREVLHALQGAQTELRKARVTALVNLESGSGAASERLEASSARMVSSMKKAEALVERARSITAKPEAEVVKPAPEAAGVLSDEPARGDLRAAP